MNDLAQTIFDQACAMNRALSPMIDKETGEILKESPVFTPGIHAGWTMADYLALEAVSAGVLRTLIEECHKAAWFQSWLNPDLPPADDNDASDKGTTAHSIVLENNDWLMVEVDPNDYPGKRGGIPDGWTNDAIKERRDEIRALGQIPMLTKDVGKVRGMVASAREFIDSLRKSEPAIWKLFQPEGGESELTICWQDGDTPCRIRPDRTSIDRTVVVDLKFTKMSAEPDAFARGPMASHKISAAFYRRGIEHVCSVTPSYTFLVCEMEPPYLCSLVGVDPTGFAIGGEKIEYALQEWAKCVAANRWPGYPTRICYPETPVWERARWEEKQILSLEQRMEYGSQG